MTLPRTPEQVEEVLERAAEELFESGLVAGFTRQTNQSEWNLANHLAAAIARYLPELEHDGDLVKPQAGRRRPDIVFHVRGTHDSNYLVVEVKKDGSQDSVLSDVTKIKTHWFRGDLRYLFGAVMNLRSDNTADIQVFRDRLGRGSIFRKRKLTVPARTERRQSSSR
jgi:hypothetical protein